MDFQKISSTRIPKRWSPKAKDINKCGSFLHIHLGFDASGLQNLPIHAIHVDNWERGITAERNVAVFSIPSVLDKSMAPKGKHVLHGYTPANEPWEIWKNLKSNELAYKELKEERCSIFLKSLRNIIPDIDNRIEIKLLGTPLTHKSIPILIVVATAQHYRLLMDYSLDVKHLLKICLLVEQVLSPELVYLPSQQVEHMRLKKS